MSSAPATLTVFIPLTVRKRNGRPKIMPPADLAPDYDDKGVDPHVLRSIAKPKLNSHFGTCLEQMP